MYFMTQENNSEFCINGNIEIRNEFFLIFGFIVPARDNLIIDVPPKQQYNKIFKKKIHSFINKYKDKHPELNRLSKFFQKLNENEYFLILPHKPEDTLILLQCINYLSSLNNRETIPEDNPIIKAILDNYNIEPFYFYEQKKLGERSKENRICRFCKKAQPETTFKKEAHAISEALGNKGIILNEECDKCNEYFSKIEQDIIKLHNFERALFKIPNKNNKIPKIQFKNGKMYYDEETKLSIFVKNDFLKDKNNPPSNIYLNNDNYIPQNAYKALCKFALSVIDDKYLDYFRKTIDWIMGKASIEKLPIVFRFFRPKNELNDCTNFKLFIRKEKAINLSLPFVVVEFNFTFYKYLYTIPLCEKDADNFLDNENLEEKLKIIFKPYFKLGYLKMNFSRNENTEIRYTISFEQRKDEK